jgi:hypothetical protein
MIALLCFFLTLFASPFKSKSGLEAENAALRHQLIVLQRRVSGRPAHEWGSFVLGHAVSMVSIDPQGHHDHPAGDPCALAPGRLPSVLALEIPLSWRPAEDRRGPARVDPADERGKSVVGSAAHPWRATQARFRGRSVERREIHGQPMQPTVPGMTRLPA